MINRFKWDICCVLVLILLFVFSPIASISAAEIQAAEPGVEPTGDIGSSDAIANEDSNPLSDIKPGADIEKPFDGGEKSLNLMTVQGTNAVDLNQVNVSSSSAGSLDNPTGTLPEERNLATLIGMPEIAVLADVDGQYINSLAENQILDGELADLVGKANLLDSIIAGRKFSRESLAALARSEQAKAQTGQALALLLPTVSVRASRGYETSEPSVEVDENGELESSDTHIRTDIALTVTQPLFNLPSFLDWRRRKVIEQVRKENYRVSDGDAYLSTVNAYLSLVSTRLQVDVTREFEAQLADLLTYIEKRAGAGAASVSDMSRVRARSEATLSSRLEQESSHLAAGIEFVRLTNIVPQQLRLPVLEDVGVSLLPETFNKAVSIALESNPEIAELAAEIQAEKINQSTAKSRYLPRFDAEYTDTYSDHAGGSSDDQRDKRLMLVMNWELFSGGKDYYYSAERSSRHKELRYRLDDERRRVVQELSANYAALATTSERIASGYQELKSISTAAEAMSKRMLSGNQSLLDLLDVYDRLYQVRSRLIELHILEMNTVAQLIRLTKGTPWAHPWPSAEPGNFVPFEKNDSLKEENPHGNAS